ncbi:MAG: penicillin-binding protein 2 [Candidatus Paceibacterota bacterium]
MNNSFRTRSTLFYIVTLFIAGLLITKLFFVQILQGESFALRADRQYVSPSQDIYDRGFIYFKQKDGSRISAATLQIGYTIAINPRVLSDARKVYKELSLIFPSLEEGDFFFRAGKKDDPYEELLEKVSKEEAERVSALSLPGVIVQKRRWRFYPWGERAAHVLGFIGYKGDIVSGRYGVERYYNDILQRDKKDLYINFFAEVFANIEQTLFYKNKGEGDIVLSLEPQVQQILENTLAEVMTKYGARGAGGIIINPTDGSLYAMASRPSFNPNTFKEESDISLFGNPLVENVYEFGSIMKPLTMAVGIDSGALSSDDTYNDKGFVVLNSARIENYDGKARGIVPLQEILNQSLNTGAVHIMQEVGRDVFREYFKKLEFGEETGIDLPGEVRGLVNNLESSRDIEFATASFGQGIATTPITMVRALSSLANGGVMLTPHAGYAIERDLRPIQLISFGDRTRVFREESTYEVTRMLVEVVDEALLGGVVALPRYSIAAKTGTAQIAKEDEGGYYDDRHLHSFFGYAPAYEPKFLVFLYILDPQGVRYASETLTHPFMDIMKFLLTYYEIPPDR